MKVVLWTSLMRLWLCITMQNNVQCDWLSHWTLSKGLCMTAIRLHHLLNMCHCPGCHQKATVYTCEWYWFLTGMYDLKLAFCDSQSVLCPKVQVRYCNNTDSWETCRWWSGVSATVGWHAFLASCVLMSVFPQTLYCNQHQYSRELCGCLVTKNGLHCLCNVRQYLWCCRTSAVGRIATSHGYVLWAGP